MAEGSTIVTEADGSVARPAEFGTGIPVDKMVSGGSGNLVGESVRVFQVNDAFLILEEEDGLRVIDQHALHEKVLYEEILEQRERVERPRDFWFLKR